MKILAVFFILLSLTVNVTYANEETDFFTKIEEKLSYQYDLSFKQGGVKEWKGDLWRYNYRFYGENALFIINEVYGKDQVDLGAFKIKKDFIIFFDTKEMPVKLAFTGYESELINEGGGSTTKCDSAKKLNINSSLYNEQLHPDGNYYRIDVSQQGYLSVFADGNTDTYGELIFSDCTIKYGSGDHSNGPNNNFRVGQPVDPGVYYIYVKSEGSQNNIINPISLSATLLYPNPDDDYPNTCLNKKVMELGSYQTGKIQGRNDVDYFKVNIKSGENIQINLDNNLLGLQILGTSSNGWCGSLYHYGYYNIARTYNAYFDRDTTLYVAVTSDESKKIMGASIDIIENYSLSFIRTQPETTTKTNNDCIVINLNGVSSLRWPVENPNKWRINGSAPGTDFHTGRDRYALDLNHEDGKDSEITNGDKVLSATDGEVLFAGKSNSSYGNSIIIKTGNDLLVRYAHLHNEVPFLEKGNKVSIGTPLGLVGKSGLSSNSNSHIHMALYDFKKSSILDIDNGNIMSLSGINEDIALKFTLMELSDSSCKKTGWPSGSAYSYGN